MKKENITSINVKMYRQGLGDCFLIKFFNKNKQSFNMLVDFGVLFGTSDAKTIMNNIAKDIAKDTNNSIDVLVSTHEHWDHLSGFIQAEEIFETIEIKNIWFAWTEDPKNKLAKKLREEREFKIKALNSFISSNNLKTDESIINSVLGFFGAMSGTNTRDALNYLKSRKDSFISYMYPGYTEKIDILPNIRFHILGPPEDEKALKKDMSNSDEIIYKLGLNKIQNNDFIDTTNQNFIFDEKYLSKQENNIAQLYNNPLNNWRKIDNDYMYFADNIALALDGDTNNTSLVFAIEDISSGKVLLFPADAQVGNWLSWKNYTWKSLDKKGNEISIDINDILARTVLYKVGHHGSHNATIKVEGLEKMIHPELIAMIPVNQVMAKKKKWKMPASSLYKNLLDKTQGRTILLDEEIKKDNPVKNKITKCEWEIFKNKITTSSLFHELNIEL